MNPINFEQANMKFGPPEDLEESQCGTIAAHRATIQGGSLDGVKCVVVAWQIDETDLQRIHDGSPIYLTMIGGGLAPHMLTTSFEEAINPA